MIEPDHQRRLPALERWRAHALQTGLSSFSLALVAAIGLVGAFSPPEREQPLFKIALAVAVLWLALFRWRPGSVVARSWVFVGTAAALIAIAAIRVGWVPGTVLALQFLAMIAGLVLGPRATYPLVVLTGLGFFFAGPIAAPHTVELERIHPENFDTWARVTAVFTVMTGMMLLTLSRARAWLEQSRVEQQDNLHAAQEATKGQGKVRKERLQVERAVRRAQQLQTVSQIAAGLGRRYAEILTLVRAGLEGIEHADGPEDRRAASQALQTAASRAVTPTQELLIFSRSQDGAPERVDVGARVLELEESLRGALRPGLTLQVEAQPGPMAMLEPQRLRQVLLNLLLNAQDAVSSRGTIQVRVDEVGFEERVAGLELEPGRYVRLQVIDDGAGVGEDVRNRAFEPFFTTRSEPGHEGLGLAVVYGVARQAGGTVRLLEREGAGTIAEVFFAPALGGPTLSADGLPRPAPSTLPTSAAPPTPLSWSQFGPTSKRWAPAKWQVEALTRLTTGALWVYLLALPFVVFGIPDELKPQSFAGLAGAALPLLACRLMRVSSYRLQVVALMLPLSVVAVGAMTALSYLSPAPMALISLVVLLVPLLLRPRWSWVALLIASACLLIAGGLHARGWVVPPLARVRLDIVDNWTRAAATLPLALLLLTRAVETVLDRALREVERLEFTAGELQQALRAQEEETAALVLAERVLTRASRLEAAGRLTGAVAHDMNNALQALLGWSDVLGQADPASPEEVQEALEQLEQATEYAETLTYEMRPASFTPAGEAPTTDLGTSLPRVVKLLRAMLPATVETHVKTERGCRVAISELDLRRVLINLAMNSGHAMPDGGRLDLRVRGHEEVVELAVEDTGVGMSEQTRSQVFAAFFTTKPEGEGTGLGLETVARLAADSGGEVELESTLGQGTKVTLRWPLANEMDDLGAGAGTADLPNLGLTVLVAERDPEVRRMVERALERAGCEVRCAEDTDEARRQIEVGSSIHALCLDADLGAKVGDVPELLAAFQARHGAAPVFVCAPTWPPEGPDGWASGPGVVPVLDPYSGARLAHDVVRRLQAATSA